jgi:hypothetical protein
MSDSADLGPRGRRQRRFFGALVEVAAAAFDTFFVVDFADSVADFAADFADGALARFALAESFNRASMRLSRVLRPSTSISRPGSVAWKRG